MATSIATATATATATYTNHQNTDESIYNGGLDRFGNRIGFGTYRASSLGVQTIVKSADGSIYKGGLDRFGSRTGFGTYRTPFMIYGVYDPQNTASLVNWREYTGEWDNDAASGFGIMRRYRGDGTCVVEYEGQWLNGDKVTVTKAKQD